MGNGEWVKGRESALWISAVPGLRPGTLLRAGAVALALVVAGLVPFRRALIPAAAGIVEIAGDRACSGLAPLESVGLCPPGV
jgi:hypothetical protein